MAVNPVIETRGLTLQVRDAAVVGDVSVRFQAGELVMLVGPNGAGKSTLLRMLAGQQQPSRGGLLFAGRSSQSMRRDEWARHITYVPQLSALSFPLSVEEVVSLGGMAHGCSVVALRQQVQEALRLWEIDYLARRDVRLLSGGEQQRCQLARSWVQVQQEGSALWLLDEPLSALDLRHQQQCMARVRELTAAGKTVVMVVHDLNLARRHADRVVLMGCGRVVADGAATEVLTARQVADTFRLDIELEGDYLRWR